MSGASTNGRQVAVNAGVWSQGSFVDEYAHRTLRPVEVMLLLRYREALGGRVLELGCGAGRLTSYLVDLASELVAIDIAPAMVEYCRETLPRGIYEVGDLSELARFEGGGFSVVWAPNNVPDVLCDAERQRFLDSVHEILAPGGLLMMSSHNRGAVPTLPRPTQLQARHPLKRALELTRVPRRVLNHRRLAPLQQEDDAFAIVNDEAHEFSLLHYYISRDAQQRQLADHDLELIECLDIEGRAVAEGEVARDYAELHYVARRPA